jgi:hypothetical protein
MRTLLTGIGLLLAASSMANADDLDCVSTTFNCFRLTTKCALATLTTRGCQVSLVSFPKLEKADGGSHSGMSFQYLASLACSDHAVCHGLVRRSHAPRNAFALSRLA